MNKGLGQLNIAGVAEWQTRQPQKLLRATSCGFNSLSRHQLSGAFLFQELFFEFPEYTVAVKVGKDRTVDAHGNNLVTLFIRMKEIAF